MKKITLVDSGIKKLFAGALTLTIAVSACTEKNSSRARSPARRAAAMKNANRGMQNPEGTQGVDPRSNQNRPPLGGPLGTPPKTPEDSGVTLPQSVDNSNPRSRSTSLETAPGTRLTQTKNESNTPAAPPTDPQQETSLGDLHQILSQLHNIYLNAWYSVNKDKSSRPRNFFEDVAAKIQNLHPIINLKDGEGTPADINNQCDRYKLVNTTDLVKNRQRLLLYDCTTKSYLPNALLSYKIQGNEWQLATTPQTLDFILPNQMGFLSTISYKPICSVTVEKDANSIKIKKALCKEWGQQLSASTTKDRKTVLFTSIKYDLSATNILEAEAQYIDYDGTNQVCRSGLMKRKAPSSTEVIYQEDDDVSACKPSPLDQQQQIPLTPSPETSPDNGEMNLRRPSPMGEPTAPNPRAAAVPPAPAPFKQLPQTNPNEGEIDFGPADAPVGPGIAQPPLVPAPPSFEPTPGNVNIPVMNMNASFENAEAPTILPQPMQEPYPEQNMPTGDSQ